MISETNQQALTVSIGNVAKSMERVGPQIDALSSAGLKRVLKAVTQVHLAESLTGGNALELKEEEQKLIDDIFHLQENILGYSILRQEIGEEDGQE